MKVAVCQLSLQVGDLVGSLSRAEIAIEDAAKEGAALVVLPELCDSGYVFRSREEARTFAAPLENSPTLARWQELAKEHEIAITGGFCELGPGDRLSNSAALVDASGVRLVYRKVHLWDSEFEIFAAGDEISSVVVLGGVRIAIAICYDLEFPEWVRTISLRGIDLLVVPTNWPLVARPDGERPIELIKAQADAASNGIWIAIADRCGPERGVDWLGFSAIVDPEGYLSTEPIPAGKAGMMIGEIDAARSKNKWVNSHNHLFEDRRCDLYDILP